LNDTPVLVAGRGHLADRLVAQLRGSSRVSRVDAVEPGPLAPFEDALAQGGVATATAIYVVDDRDAANIQFVLAALKLRPGIRITMTLSNERLVPHLQRLHPEFVVVNPWEVVAPDLVDVLKAPSSAVITSEAALPSRRQRRRDWIRANSVLVSVAGAFAVLIAVVSVFFHYSEGLDWITTLYFVVTMATTTGFGDISLRASTPLAKMVGMLTMVSAITFVSLFFSLVIDRMVARRTQNLLGQRRHRMSGHVIVCGLGRVGYHLVRKLRAESYPVLVIEKDANNRFLPAIRESGVPVMIADATLANTLADAAVVNASAVASVIQNDLVNLEVGLNARALRPKIRVVLRVFDRETAEELKRLDIHYAISTSAIAAQRVLERGGGV
jgi:Trk K+ transport system NAD-binding subunit